MSSGSLILLCALLIYFASFTDCKGVENLKDRISKGLLANSDVDIQSPTSQNIGSLDSTFFPEQGREVGSIPDTPDSFAEPKGVVQLAELAEFLSVKPDEEGSNGKDFSNEHTSLNNTDPSSHQMQMNPLMLSQNTFRRPINLIVRGNSHSPSGRTRYFMRFHPQRRQHFYNQNYNGGFGYDAIKRLFNHGNHPSTIPSPSGESRPLSIYRSFGATPRELSLNRQEVNKVVFGSVIPPSTFQPEKHSGTRPLEMIGHSFQHGPPHRRP